MILKKRAAQGIATAGLLVLMTGVAQVAAMASVPETTEVSHAMAAKTDLATNTSGTAGVVTVVDSMEEDAIKRIETASVTRTSAELVSTGETEEEPAMTEEEQLWQNRLMADVNEYLNVRSSGDENSDIVGKLYKGDVAEVVETGDVWTHITSGNVDGYVKNEFCVFGLDALAYANANFNMEAEIMTNGLRVRSEASEDASVITALAEGTTLIADKDAETVDGWVAVIYGGSTRYVSADYVDLSLALGEGITIEEEQAELQRIAEEEAARKAAQVTEVTTVQNEAVAASADDVTLLAAIIQCEAGNEVYEGQLAVGAVIMNRVRSGSYPSTIYDVIYAPSQFPPAGRGTVAKVVANGPKDSCIQAAQEALNGVDNTGGATKFKRASSGHAGVVIGNHVFY